MPTTKQGELRQDECYCRSCGEIIKEVAEICPECGVRQSGPNSSPDGDVPTDKSQTGQFGYTIIGFLSGLIAFVLVPVVFGPLSIFCGYQLYKKYHETLGLITMAWGGSGLILGMVIGMLMW